MRVMLHLHFPGYTGLFQESMSLIQSSILLLREQTNQSIFPIRRNKGDSLNFVLPLKNYFLLKETMMNTCKYVNLVSVTD